MVNHYEIIIPSKMNYITLPLHQVNNTKLKLTVGFNSSIYDNERDYL